MTTEGTYIYSCPMPDHNTLQGGPIPPTGVITISTPSMLTDQDQIQSLIDTVAKQQNEIEVLKKALNMALAYISEDAREQLSFVASAIRNSKFNDAENQIYKDAAKLLVLEGK